MTKQYIDPLIEELHETRREIAKRFNYDIAKISEDARRRQALEGRPLWQPESANKMMHPSGGGSLSDCGSSTPAAG
jgi:hypothetical protein